MSKKILISTIGSRGEVQPALALALELRALGHQAVLCVPPNFKEWVESFGFPCVPVGPDMQKLAAADSRIKQRRPTLSAMRQMVRSSVIEQFEATADAAQGCDLIFTAGDLQHAGKSIAESLNIPHLHATYCPITLRSADHTPPNVAWLTPSQTLPRWSKGMLWRLSDAQWNLMFREPLNERRLALGLSPVKDVPSHIANEHSWVATDAVLAPAGQYNKNQLLQVGAWLLRDERPLPNELEKFLAAGEPPIYFGFGSMRRNDRLNQMLLEAARAVGRRALVSKGWGDFNLSGSEADALIVGDVSHAQLFPRVAVVVHHGGAGTTHAAARSGRPQVIVPHVYDQFYWAHRVAQLGIGAAASRASKLTEGDLTSALRSCLQSSVMQRAQVVAGQMDSRGAQISAERLAAMAGA